MPWADAVDVDTLHCAFETMQSLARHGEWSAGPVPTLDRFLRDVEGGSPAKGGRKSGRRAPVLLDGMHRLVAAAIDGRPARVCFVSL